MSPPLSPQQIRQQLQKQRRQLPDIQQSLHGIQSLQNLKKQQILTRPGDLGVFLSHLGELDTRPLLAYLFRQGHRIYLPKIVDVNQGKMVFCPVLPHSPLQNHYWGMQEPLCCHRSIPPHQLSHVFVPLVAFDLQGHRLGMGGGFYDRYLAKVARHCQIWGWAHSFQQVKHLDGQPWDIPLHGVISEKGICTFRPRGLKLNPNHITA